MGLSHVYSELLLLRALRLFHVYSEVGSKLFKKSYLVPEPLPSILMANRPIVVEGGRPRVSLK